MEGSQAVTARHAELWKQRSGRFSRAVFWSLSVLGVLVVGFFEPHEVLEQQLDAERKEARQLQDKAEALTRDYESVREATDQVRNVHARIKAEPWRPPVEQLKATLRTPRIQPRRAEEAADDTIRRMSQSVTTEVVEPLRAACRAAGNVPQLTGKLDEFERGLDTWKRSKIGNREWYETIRSKDLELKELTSYVSEQQQELTRIADAALAELSTRQSSLRTSRDEAESNLDAVDAQIDSLEDDVKDVLPSWLESIADYRSVVQSQPWIVLGLLLYLGLLSAQIRASFVRVRAALYPDGASQRDPNLSSLWTVVDRGLLGSLATAGAYLLVIGGLVYLFARGTDLVGSWAARHGDEAWWISTKCLPPASWLVPLLAFGAAALVAVAIARDRREGSPGNDARDRSDRA